MRCQTHALAIYSNPRMHADCNVSVTLNHEEFPVTSPIGFLKSGMRTRVRGLHGSVVLQCSQTVARWPGTVTTTAVQAQNHGKPFPQQFAHPTKPALGMHALGRQCL